MKWSCSVVSDSLRPHGHQASPSVGFLGKSTGVGCHFLLYGIFPTQGSNPGLPHCRQTLYRLSHQGAKKVFCSRPGLCRWLNEGQDVPGGSVVNNSPANAGDAGLIPGLGRFSGGGNGNPLQHSCLGNTMDRRAWWATNHVVTKKLDTPEQLKKNKWWLKSWRLFFKLMYTWFIILC